MTDAPAAARTVEPVSLFANGCWCRLSLGCLGVTAWSQVLVPPTDASRRTALIINSSLQPRPHWSDLHVTRNYNVPDKPNRRPLREHSATLWQIWHSLQLYLAVSIGAVQVRHLHPVRFLRTQICILCPILEFYLNIDSEANSNYSGLINSRYLCRHEPRFVLSKTVQKIFSFSSKITKM